MYNEGIDLEWHKGTKGAGKQGVKRAPEVATDAPFR